MQNFRMNLPRGAEYIISKFEENGYRADVVGGCVRDAMLGGTPYDYDITTNASPEITKVLFAECKIIDTGIAHGTVTVMIDGAPYEVTTYRIDGDYIDNRHPKAVEFTKDIKEDLSRRDFTVNAMAYSHRWGITDLFCGKEDLENKIIRAVGDASLRFEEDSLRILRALRFASVLGFEIEKNTANSIFEKKRLQKNLSGERIFVELKKLFGGVASYEITKKYSAVIACAMGVEAILHLVSESAWRRLGPELRMLSLFVGNADALRVVLERLKVDSKTKTRAPAILDKLSSLPKSSEEDIREFLIGDNTETHIPALTLAHACGMIPEATLIRARSLCEGGMPRAVSDLDVDGADILALGIKGRRVGVVLKSLLRSVSQGSVKNEKEDLIKEAKLYIGENNGV